MWTIFGTVAQLVLLASIIMYQRSSSKMHMSFMKQMDLTWQALNNLNARVSMIEKMLEINKHDTDREHIVS